MPSGRKSASVSPYFQPTVPLPPQTILSIETELSYFRHRRPLLLDTELRPFSLRNRTHPYQHPIPRRGVTPDRDCLDWPQYPLTHAVGAVLRRSTDTAPPRARSRQPTPTPARSRQPTPARQPTPGPSTTENQSSPILHRAKSVRFPNTDRDRNDEDDDGDDDDNSEPHSSGLGGKVATPDADGLISKPDGEVGRLTRGYSLPVALGWKSSLYKSTKELVSSYVENYLNHAYSESKQPQGHVESLTKLILARHPGIVEQYRDGWPIHDMIHLRLKYTSGRFSSGQVVSQGSTYPQDPKKALKELLEKDKAKRQDKGKGKQHASAAS